MFDAQAALDRSDPNPLTHALDPLDAMVRVAESPATERVEALMLLRELRPRIDALEARLRAEQARRRAAGDPDR